MKVCLWLCLLAAMVAACSSLSKDNKPYQDRVVEQQRRRAADYMDLRLYSSAVATLDSLTRLRPNDSDLFEYLADAHRGAGNVDAAIKAYEQAIDRTMAPMRRT
jgi:Tfp pilus assembly protein PilF